MRKLVVALVLVSVALGLLVVLVENDAEGGSCDLHHIPYAVEIIHVHYGLPAMPELTEAQLEWREARHAAWREGFRNSHVANTAGGCVVRPARFALVNYCPECRKAEEEWYAKHGHMPPAEAPK